MKSFGGDVLFLDRSDINTDEIIPAKYLTEVTKEALAPYLLEDLTLKGFDPNGSALRNAKVVVARENFGCGSSREHAPWALEVNQITLVIATSYARIFRQNMFNCGMLAVSVAPEEIDRIFALADATQAACQVDLNAHTLTFQSDGNEQFTIPFSISPFDEALVRAGGWVEFADANY